MARTKQDRARIALKQKHEVRYLKEIAAEQLFQLMKCTGRKVYGTNSRLMYRGVPMGVSMSNTKLKRICRALLKVLK